MVTPLQMALALKALTTAYKLVKKYQATTKKAGRSKRKALPKKNSTGSYR